MKDPAKEVETKQSTEEKKPVEAKPEDKKPDDKKAEDKPKGAPEKYEPFKVPEGYELDAKVAEGAQELFKKHNLSQEAAQELVDFYSKQQLGVGERLEQLIVDTRKGWRDEIAKDKSLGNGTDGFRDEVKATIGRAIDGLGPELATQLKSAMDLTGAGDHPNFVRAFYKLAQQVTEGKPVSPGGPVAQKPQGPRSAAQAMYPELPSATG